MLKPTRTRAGRNSSSCSYIRPYYSQSHSRIPTGVLLDPPVGGKIQLGKSVGIGGNRWESRRSEPCRRFPPFPTTAREPKFSHYFSHPLRKQSVECRSF